MARTGIALLALIVVWLAGGASGCSRTPPEPEETAILVGDLVVVIPVVPIDSLVVADVFGDHDLIASTEELEALNDYYAAHRVAWCVSGLASKLWDATMITGDQVRMSFGALGTKPYPSEQDLRTAYDGINIRTPWVSIVVVTRAGRRFFIERFMRSPGPGIGTTTWVDLQIQ